jgi:hypothetical protein
VLAETELENLPCRRNSPRSWPHSLDRSCDTNPEGWPGTCSPASEGKCYRRGLRRCISAGWGYSSAGEVGPRSSAASTASARIAVVQPERRSRSCPEHSGRSCLLDLGRSWAGRHCGRSEEGRMSSSPSYGKPGSPSMWTSHQDGWSPDSWALLASRPSPRRSLLVGAELRDGWRRSTSLQ